MAVETRRVRPPSETVVTRPTHVSPGQTVIFLGPYGGIEATMEFVGPERAAADLAGHRGTRKVRPSWVKRLASYMSAGRFQFTPESVIAYDTAGNLLNAQHRLGAIVESGVGQWFFVMRGFPSAVTNVLDSPKVRSFKDVTSKDAIYGAVARRLQFGSSSKTSMDRLSVQLIYDRHREAIDYVVEECFLYVKASRDPEQRGVATAPILGAFARAYYHEDREQLKHAAYILRTGLSTDPNDQLLLKLRNALLAMNPGAGGTMASERYNKTERVLGMWLRREVPANLEKFRIVAGTRELWPLPEEEVTKDSPTDSEANGSQPRS